MEDDQLPPYDESIDPALKFSLVPRDQGVIGRIGQIGAYPGQPHMSQGLCPSCLNTGFVHERRGDELGVLQNPYGHGLMRCDCPRGEKIRDEDRQHAKR